MGLKGDEVKVKRWDAGKAKGKNNKQPKKKGVTDGGEGESSSTGCWVKLRFIGSCISSRSKVDSSVSGTSATQCGKPCFSQPDFLFIIQFHVLDVEFPAETRFFRFPFGLCF